MVERCGLERRVENFVLAGPGVGSPDENGDRESLLQAVPNVVPVRADGLALLVGRTVVRVIYANDVVTNNGSANLSGPTLGRVAFKVVSVRPGSRGLLGGAGSVIDHLVIGSSGYWVIGLVR